MAYKTHGRMADDTGTAAKKRYMDYVRAVRRKKIYEVHSNSDKREYKLGHFASSFPDNCMMQYKGINKTNISQARRMEEMAQKLKEHRLGISV